MNSKPKAKRSKQKPADITGGYTERDFQIGFAKNPPDFFVDKPNDATYTSDIWENGMGFIYSTATSKVVSHWYKCTVAECSRVFNCYLPDGNGKLSRHIENHSSGVPYALLKNELVGLLSLATKIGAECGQIPAEEFSKIVPASGAFKSSGFLVNAEDVMRKHWEHLKESADEGNTISTDSETPTEIQSTSSKRRISYFFLQTKCQRANKSDPFEYSSITIGSNATHIGRCESKHRFARHWNAIDSRNRPEFQQYIENV